MGFARGGASTVGAQVVIEKAFDFVDVTNHVVHTGHPDDDEVGMKSLFGKHGEGEGCVVVAVPFARGEKLIWGLDLIAVFVIKVGKVTGELLRCEFWIVAEVVEGDTFEGEQLSDRAE